MNAQPTTRRPARLLVVDDNKVNRLLLARSLMQQGHGTAMAENGFLNSSIDVQVIPCPDNEQYGYSGILTASGCKAPARRK